RGGLAENRSVERIIWARREHVLAGIEQRGQAEVHCFARTVSHEYVLNADDSIAFGFVPNCFERFRNAGRWRVAILIVANSTIRGLNHVRGRSEIKNIGIANVQVEN